MKYIIGVDEVGTGACAGPIFVCAVKAPSDWILDGLNDSKKLNSQQRQTLSDELIELSRQNVIQYNLQSFDNNQIDLFGLAFCHKTAIANAINALFQVEDKVIIDGNIGIDHFKKRGLRADIKDISSVVKADAKYDCVMAASIIAKHHRDNIMLNYHNTYPQYGFDTHVGYIVPLHKEAIKIHGLSNLHRKSYKIKLTN